jgi:hypothetical protein
MRKLYEWIDASGDGVVSGWKLQQRQATKLDSKLVVLRAAEVDSSGKVRLGASLIGGPGIDGYSSIYKLKIHGNVALRPMACLGPLNVNLEWTILARAIEKDGVLNPADAAATAERRRQEIMRNPKSRRLLWAEDDDPSK